MIRSFADRRTEELYRTGRSARIPSELARRAVRKLEYIDLASSLDDLRVPAGNRLHALHRAREGQHSIAISATWRVCFRWEDGDAFDVEVTDYH